MKAEILIASDGAATGELLKLSAPISFWGGVDPASGDIIDARHPQCGVNIAGKIIALPGTIGSSSSSSVLLELVRTGRAPAALLLVEPDAILLLGLVVAQDMGWPTPPALRCERPDFAALTAGAWSIMPDGRIERSGGHG